MKITHSFALAALALGACAGRHQEPTTVSSASATGYAQRYPSELMIAAETMRDDEAEAARVTGELPNHQSDLPGGSQSELVVSILDEADKAGKGRQYAEGMAEVRVVRRFVDEERGPLAARANASSQQKLSEAKCGQEVDISGTVAYAIKEGADKQLEKRLRARSDAQLLIERNKANLGQPSANALQKIADDITLASYLVNVALPDDERRLRQMIDEKRKVKSTLEDAIAAEQALQQQSFRSEAERRASRERVADLGESQKQLDSSVSTAEQGVKDADKRIEDAKKRYEAAFEALKKKVLDAAEHEQEAGSTR